MERGRIEKRCKIIKDITNIGFRIESGILGNMKVCFKENLPRRERERINKEMKNCKLKTLWGNKNNCMLISK